ncbi:DNA/RNA non-specific endonuclease [Burkholderiaceae bacterium DAT-1]|nr:DNA/RNA non-specific endonuclease [Burkholderiaceae bacterium DAT-1]
MKLIVRMPFVALLYIPLTLHAGCEHLFVAQHMPQLQVKAMQVRTTALCFQEYALLYSGLTRTPVWVGEHLTRAQIQGAQRIKRNNAFHEESRLPEADRSTLADYSRSGFDRGHMAPAGDFSTLASQHESFSMANMAPQHPANNRGIWEALESQTRELALQKGEVYVVSGPIFEGERLKRLNGRVLVPVKFFKAVHVPATGVTGAWIVNNAPGREVEVKSLDQLEALSGIRAFPGLSAAQRSTAGMLPEPDGKRSSPRMQLPKREDDDWYAQLLRWLRALRDAL